MKAADSSYPMYHIAPPDGWLNDPNGLCQMDGVYHFYFQYTPDDAKGGLKYWGHYQSTDLIHWTFTGAVLSPDCSFDKDGVYSGSALVEDGKIYLYYTGNVKEEGDHDYIRSGRGANTVLVETKDGHTMGEKQCLMSNEDYPKDVTCHVRDPKVFVQGEHYYMVQGARTKEDKGVILLFESSDKIHWRYHNRIQSQEPFGYMWECPDLFLLDDVNILSLSPQGLSKEECRFQNQYQSGYFIVEGDYTAEKKYSLLSFREWDMGFDFYAPQTFQDEKGRRILVGWAGMIDCEEEYDNHITVKAGWQHMFTLPRKLTLENNIVYQQPVEELKQLRGKEETIIDTEFSCSMTSELLLEDIESNSLKMQIGSGLFLRFDTASKIFSMSFEDAMGSGRKVRKAKLDTLKNLHIFIDRSIIEIFINDGLFVFTSRFYTKDKELEVKIINLPGSIKKWDLAIH